MANFGLIVAPESSINISNNSIMILTVYLLPAEVVKFTKGLPTLASCGNAGSGILVKLAIDLQACLVVFKEGEKGWDFIIQKTN